MTEISGSVLRPGLVLDDGRYELLDKVDEGQQAEIWRIRNLDYPEQQLVGKFWYAPWCGRGERDFQQRSARLEQEARLLASVVSMFKVDPHFRIKSRETIDGEDYIVLGVAMDFAPEGNLKTFLDGNRALPMLQRIRLLEHLATGLSDLQQASLIHNDIKPANILMFRFGGQVLPKFSDFGLAFIQGSAPVGGGTILYMAPELINEFGRPSFNVTPSTRTDIYSLGLVFYEVLLGEHPFIDIIAAGDAGKALAGYFATHHTINFAPSREPFDAGIVDIVQRMCSRDPENRPTMHEVCEELAEAVFRIRGQAPLEFRTDYPEAVDTFRWTQEVHKGFNESEVLVFLRGSNIERDTEYLAKALSGRRLHGFSIFRLLGSRDYLLRIWRRDTDKVALADVLRAYEAERSGVAEQFDPMLRWPCSRTRSKLPLNRPGALLKMVHTLAIDPSDLPTREAIRVGLIHGKSKNARERGKSGRKAIRAVCRISYLKDIRLDLANAIGDQIHLKVSKMAGVKEVEVFANPGDRGNHAEFVVIAELDSFHRYRDVLMCLDVTLGTFLGEAHQVSKMLRFRSHFEMDERSPYESYDGRLFFELHRRRGSHEEVPGGLDRGHGG